MVGCMMFNDNLLGLKNLDGILDYPVSSSRSGWLKTWGKLIQKLLLNQKCMGYLVRAYYSISPTKYYKDDSCWSANLKSNTTEDVIGIGSFMEVLVLNHYVLVRKILDCDVENGPGNTSTVGVAKRLSQTFREESTGLRSEASKMLWSDSASMAYLIYCIPYVSIRLHFLEEEWRGKDISLTLLKLNEANTEEPMVLVDIPENLAENDSIVVGHGLSSEITQSPGWSSDSSEGSENNRSFEDGERSDDEDSEDGAFSKEGGSKTPHVRRFARDSRASVRYSLSANYLLLIENGESESYSEALSSKEFVQLKKAINEEMVLLEKNQTCSLVRLPTGKKVSQSL
ncbi:hypothetical protein Tco_0201559 [Tanacetum coccineum]